MKTSKSPAQHNDTCTHHTRGNRACVSRSRNRQLSSLPRNPSATDGTSIVTTLSIRRRIPSHGSSNKKVREANLGRDFQNIISWCDPHRQQRSIRCWRPCRAPDPTCTPSCRSAHLGVTGSSWGGKVTVSQRANATNVPSKSFLCANHHSQQTIIPANFILSQLTNLGAPHLLQQTPSLSPPPAKHSYLP